MPEETKRTLHDDFRELKEDVKELREEHHKFEKDFAGFQAKILTKLDTISDQLKIQNERVTKRESEIEALRRLHDEDRNEQNALIKEIENRVTAVETKSSTLSKTIYIGLVGIGAAAACIALFLR